VPQASNNLKKRKEFPRESVEPQEFRRIANFLPLDQHICSASLPDSVLQEISGDIAALAAVSELSRSLFLSRTGTIGRSSSDRLGLNKAQYAAGYSFTRFARLKIRPSVPRVAGSDRAAFPCRVFRCSNIEDISANPAFTVSAGKLPERDQDLLKWKMEGPGGIEPPT
jgi:hypothetical protein